MALTLTQGAHEWSSAHRPINFTYAYESKVTASISNDGGYAKVILAGAFTETPAVGDWLQLYNTASGNYDGVHKIRVVNSTTSFTLETVFGIADLDPANCKFIRIPEFKLYAGYDTGELYDTELPLTLVATFTPKNSPDNNVKIDLSGYLKSIFTIEPNASGGVDFAAWNRYRLYFDGAYSADYYVVNAAIDSDVLNKYYVKTGRFLTDYDTFRKGTPENRQYVMSCGASIMSRIQGNGIVGYVFTDGDTSDTGSGGTGGIFD
jgi:hypothetical protein